MKKQKANDHNTEKKHHTKLASLYPDLFFFREEPIPYAFIERFMEEWREWSQKPRSLRISQFWDEKGVSIKYLYQWIEKYPEVKETYQYILNVLATKRDIGALYRELDGQQVRAQQWKYDKEDKEHIAWLASIAKANSEIGGGKNVVYTVLADPIPDSPLVPEKIDVE